MADLGVGDIVKSITGDVKLLVRDEVQLAKSELVPAAKNAGIGAGLFGVAGYFAITALLILYFAAAFGLATVLPEWLAFLIVGVVLLLIAAVAGLLGLVLVRRVKGPQRTIASAKETVAELKAAVQRSNEAAQAEGRGAEVEGEVVAARALRDAAGRAGEPGPTRSEALRRVVRVAGLREAFGVERLLVGVPVGVDQRVRRGRLGVLDQLLGALERLAAVGR